MVHESEKNSGWTFLSNHSHVILCLVEDSSMRIRDIAHKVGITERAVQTIISDLSESGYIDKMKEGRCNRYLVHKEKKLRHPVESHKNIKDLIELIQKN